MKAWLPYASIEEARHRLGPVADEIEIEVITDDGLPTTGTQGMVLMGLPIYGANRVLKLVADQPVPDLRWIQLATAGYEHVIDRVPDDVGLCNAAGVHDAGASELAIGLALTALHRLDRFAVDRLTSRFAPVDTDSLADRRILIVGYGHLGSAVERRLAGFEVASVTRVARTARTDPEVHPVGDLPDLAADADVIFLCLPGGEDTRHIVDADLMARMADGTLIVNIGRGVLLDLDALLAEKGRIRAALDVTDPEPLPPDHPLWAADFVTWSPHEGGQSRASLPRYDALIAQQLGRLVRGEALLNVVRSPR
ncbi:MAG: NAD(P)-binding domain-containing protein [Propionibacteriaceae bacterium]|nr:NAD(P)-binding domain-containing protein [Propionibacteriaceae bacterium]